MFRFKFWLIFEKKTWMSFLKPWSFYIRKPPFWHGFFLYSRYFKIRMLHRNMLNFQTSSSNVSTLASTLNDNASDMLIRRKRSSAVAPPRPALVAGRGGEVLRQTYTFTLTIWETIWFTNGQPNLGMAISYLQILETLFPWQMLISPLYSPKGQVQIQAKVHMPATADASCANGLTWAFQPRVCGSFLDDWN